jgi:streptogramin lyase
MKRILLGIFLLTWAVPAFAQTEVFVLKFGKHGTKNGEFNSPMGIATDTQGNVYVSDYSCRIQKFTGAGVFLASWGSPGTGDVQFDNPTGLAVDPEGNIYVADWGNHRIQKLSSTGSLITKWGSQGAGPGHSTGPSVALDERIVFIVMNRQSSAEVRLQRTYLDGWTGVDAGEFWYPGACPGPDGNLFVTDFLDRIQKFDASRTTSSLGLPGTQDEASGRWQSLRIGRQRHAADSGNHSVKNSRPMESSWSSGPRIRSGLLPEQRVRQSHRGGGPRAGYSCRYDNHIQKFATGSDRPHHLGRLKSLYGCPANP